MPHKSLTNTGQLAAESIAKGDLTGWFEELYVMSAGDPSVIPWAGQKPNPYLIEWLETQSIQGSGKTALVIGCGLGDDAEALAACGYTVTAFDISPTAIDWAKKRFPNSHVEYSVADLFDLPEKWLGAFDFIFECYTIQALPRSVRSDVIGKVASVVAPNGSLLIICRGWRDDQTEDTLPWGLKKTELEQLKQLGFSERSFEEFWDRDDPTRYRFRIVYQKEK
ncbi:MAG: class I SAM-dependent methyltransferase [Candidatus Kapaibacterium sp.]